MAQKPIIYSRRANGFTLIEIIVGLVAISASFLILTALILPQAQRSAEPILQVRATALGRAFLDEILSRSFDENSDRVGGEFRCGDDLGTESDPEIVPCTPAILFGEDPSLRPSFNDIDDFHGLQNCDENGEPSGSCLPIADALLTPDFADLYADFGYRIDVCYSSPEGSCVEDQTSAGVTNFKRILVVIRTPLGQDIAFSAIRGNY